MFCLRLSIFLWGLLMVPICAAQIHPTGTPAVTNYSRSDYQAGTQNWSIAQDYRGIMYFGNNKGLLEFDGTHWDVFPLPNRTIVRSIAFPEKGKIYLGGQNEIGYLQQDKRGHFIYHSLIDKIKEEWQGFEDVWKIFILSDQVFFCTEKAVFALRNGEMNVLAPPSGRFENFFECAGSIYFQDRFEGLFRVSGATLEPVDGGLEFSEKRIVSILNFDENHKLLVTVSDGLYLMDDSVITPWTNTVSDFLIANQAYCAIRLADGNYAIGTSQNGLLMIDTTGNPLMHLNTAHGLQNNTVLSVFQDEQENLWMGLDNGIDLAEINSPFSIIRAETGIKGTGYTSIIHNDKLYLGTNQGLYYSAWNGHQGLSDQPAFEQVENAIGQVWNINQLGQGFVVSQHKGASYLEGDRVAPFSSIQGAWKFMELKENPGYAIEGTYTGLVVYKNAHAEDPNRVPDWIFVKHLEGFGESARVFEQDATGHIWVSHAYKGLYRISLSENLEAIEHIDFYNAENGLPVELFINVAKVRNEIVFTTPAGIYRYDSDEDIFEEHPDLSEIFGEKRNVHRLIEDQRGHIWFSIDNEFGVLRVDDTGVVNKLEIAYFNQLQEELVDGFEHVYAYDDKNVFIGTEKGFVHFNPAQKPGIDFPFGILIRKVTSITSGDSVLYWGNAIADSTAQLPVYAHRMNDFRFDFSAPYFEKSNHLQYQFRLEGFDKEWSGWTPKTQKEYTNLPYGDYTFIAQARNAYGQLSEQDSFRFSISPPWYATIYARLIYFVLSLIALSGLVWFVKRREKKKTEAFRREQTEKLQRKEEEFKTEVEKSETEIVALRNEKLRSDINHKNSQLASATMHLVQKSEILMKLKSDLTSLASESPHEFKRKIDRITRAIESDIQLDNNWEQFEIYFDQVHENFFKRLRQNFPDLTPKDQKLCAYLRMNLSTKEIAPLLNISVRGVEISRYRVRKKLGIDSDTNLVEFVMDV